MGVVLVVDDDKLLREALSAHVADLGHQVLAAGSLKEGRKLVEAEPVDVVFLDVWLPDGDGLEAVPLFQKAASAPEVIIITGVGDPDGAAIAIRYGVWDYLQKPFSTEEIERHIRRVIEYRQRRGPADATDPARRDGIIGSSRGLLECLEKVSQCAASNATVLITGETGTGKELFARAIHHNSLRADKRFVVVDCAALPETLVESLLFGHHKGAFSGANEDADGLLLQADGGTLFLDEVAEMPLEVQKKFLRVLQDSSFRPLGAHRETSSEFRLIAATSQPLWRMADQERFRKDLLFRIQQFHIDIPPLRHRREDISELALYFVHRLIQRRGATPKAISQEFLEILEAQEWPGNVRELMSTLESALLAAERDSVLYPVHLPEPIRLHHVREAVARKRSDGGAEEYPALPAVSPPSRPLPTFREAREATLLAMEESYLRRLAAETEGDIAKMGEISGLGKSRLYSLLKKHKITMG